MRPPLGEVDGVRRDRDRLAVWINKASQALNLMWFLPQERYEECGNEGLRERYSTERGDKKCERWETEDEYMTSDIQEQTGVKILRWKHLEKPTMTLFTLYTNISWFPNTKFRIPNSKFIWDEIRSICSDSSQYLLGYIYIHRWHNDLNVLYVILNKWYQWVRFSEI